MPEAASTYCERLGEKARAASPSREMLVIGMNDSITGTNVRLRSDTISKSDHRDQRNLHMRVSQFLASLVVALFPLSGFAQSAFQVGSLSQPTARHSATLLNDGRVLVASRDGRAELFNPSSNQWALGNAMTVGSFRHSATLLGDGSVMVAGGTTGADRLARVEVFSPTSNSWSAIAPLLEGRAGHTATLLANGKVLVAGGSTYAPPAPIGLSSTELYDPVAAQWAQASPLPVALYGHTANRVANGDVIVLGGEPDAFSSAGSSYCFRYKPSLDQWITCPAIPSLRSAHNATSMPDGRILVTGGLVGNNTKTTEDVFDPLSDTWSTAALPPRRSVRHATSLYKGDSAVVIGGVIGPVVYTPAFSQTYRYFDASNSSKQIFPDTGLLRDSHTATALQDGRILVAGGFETYAFVSQYGYYAEVASATTYVIDREALTFNIDATKAPYLPAAGERYSVAVTLADNRNSNPILPTPTGVIAVSDGTAGCTITLPAKRCEITTTVSGTKTISAGYGGDVNFSASAGNSARPAGDAARAHLRGSALGSIQSSPPAFPGPNLGCGGRAPGPFGYTGCDLALAPGATATFQAIPAAGSSFTGWLGACTGMAATCQLTMPPTGSIVVSATFAPTNSLPLTLDVDGDGSAKALTDGALMARLLSFVHDEGLIAASVGSGSIRTSARDIETRLMDMSPLLDIAGNGRIDAATDGVLLLRYLLGLRGEALIANALGSNARRGQSSEIESYLQALAP